MNRDPILLASRVTFAASWILVTLIMSQTEGLFVRPLLFQVKVAGNRYPVGAILLIPVVAATTTAAAALRNRGQLSASRRLGHPGMTIAVFSLGMLALVRSWPIHGFAVLIPSVVAVLLFWGVYAYTLLAWAPAWLAATLGGLAVLHGTVAMIQFVGQRSIGLTYLGELALNPQVRGTSVIEVAGQRWLRAYGLLPHPNVLGGVLGIALLVCLGTLLQPGPQTTSFRRRLWVAAISAGGGLLVSFSRSAWLGTGLGLLYLAATTRLWQRLARFLQRANWRTRRLRTLGTATAVLLVITGATVGRFMGARMGGAGSGLEQNSISERTRDIAQAWMLIRHLPLTGVGTGYYVDALWAWADATGQTFPAFQDVHNVPLMMGAEMGIAGIGLWLWMVSLPIVAVAWAARKAPAHPFRAALGAAFVLIWVAGMLDIYPHFLHFRSAALLGALCGVWAQESGKERCYER
jgi:O-antigen ligase